MAAILNMVMMLGMFGVGIYLVIHRCDMLGLCDQGAAAETPSDDSTSTTTTADAKDNGKSKKCNCCKCTQVDVNTIKCDTGAGTVGFTNGLSLAAQCKACGDDPKICKDAKAAIKQKKIDDDPRPNNVPADKTTNNPGMRCSSGYVLNSNGVCVKRGSNSNAKPSSQAPGCKAGEYCDMTCPAGAKTCICKCTKSKVKGLYTRAMHAYAGPTYRMSYI